MLIDPSYPKTHQNPCDRKSDSARLQQLAKNGSLSSYHGHLFWRIAGLFMMVIVFSQLMLNQTTAQEISVQLSGRKAYLGSSLTLTVTITDAESHRIPELPKIDGCRFEQVGPAQQSTRQFSFNGFSQVSKSMTYRFSLTPQREGEFEIPELTFFLDGKKRVLEPVTFFAEKSETGDLMFVEVESDRESIFVGESLPLTLKIWIKPYRDEKRNLTISISDMFNLISDSSKWGVFEDTLRASDPRKGRVNAKKVQRDNADGEPTEYYLYEIPAQLYTKKEGAVAIGNITVVCDYPTSLRESRSMFGSVFDDPRRLAIASSRPIVATAITDTLLAKPIPTEGRPDDYRGAIGKYRIMASTSDRTVYEGDPIQLRLGIIGDGPMDLLPAPPLSSIKALTDDFKVADQPLAGVVQGREKIFPVTIRPTSDAVKEIPPIPLSFFDPKTETFETVYSDPIPITVLPMNSISLGEFGGNATNVEANVTEAVSASRIDKFENDYSTQTLDRTESKYASSWWWYLWVGPPILWLTTTAITWSPTVVRLFSQLRSAKATCRSAIQRSETGVDLVAALTSWIGRKTGNQFESCKQAVGALRSIGLREEAIELELFFDSMQNNDLHDVTEQQAAKEQACQWLETLHQRFDAKATRIQLARTGQIMLWLALLVIPNQVLATQTDSAEERWQSVLREANESYQAGQTSTNAADEKSAYTIAAEKYQWLIDQGIHNAKLYLNAGNAYAQQGEYPRAIANYRRVLRLKPNYHDAQSRLDDCLAKLQQSRTSATKLEADSAELEVNQSAGLQTPGMLDNLLSGLNRLETAFRNTTLRLLGRTGLLSLAAFSWISFWGLIIAATLSRHRPVSGRLFRWTLLPLILSLLFGNAALTDYEHFHRNTAVVMENSLVLREGDGDSFPVVHTWSESAGAAVEILTHREGWAEVRCPNGIVGWTNLNELELIMPVSRINRPDSINSDQRQIQ